MIDRKSYWETVYHEKSPAQVSWYQLEPSLSLKLIQDCKITFQDPIIDVGGGASTLVDKLLHLGYQNLSVLDIAKSALEYSQARLGQQAKTVNWIECDITQFNTNATYTIWHDRAVFHFLTDPEDQQKYVTKLLESVRPGGFVIIAAFALTGPKRCSGLDIVQYDKEKLIETLGKQFQLIDIVPEKHRTPAGSEQQFNYYRFKFNK